MRTLVRVAAVGGALAAGAAVGVVAPQAQAAGQSYGAAYVWADQPTADSYLPRASYQWNSVHPAQAVNRVSRTGIGSYVVTMKDLTGVGGTVSVTAYGASSHHCKVVSWFPTSGAQHVNVNCFDGAGNPADSRFVASYTNRSTTPHPMAYAWADQPTAADYEPHPLYRFNSTGAALSIARFGVGHYVVRLPGFRRNPQTGDITGTAKVTAYGPGSARCNIEFGPGGIAAIESVLVQCTTPAGQRVDSRFTVSYVEDGNLLGADGHDTAYARVRADGTLLGPPREWEFPRDGSISSQRTATGAYRVRLPVDFTVGHAQVTADFTAGFPLGRHCKVSRWNAAEGVVVLCFAADGSPLDAGFQLTFVGPRRD
ncbi:MAG TPA: hypothetical protein VFR67_29940 [Pilimelia sp.]|nr:hypothetical protein [Pilimelia sp.]